MIVGAVGIFLTNSSSAEDISKYIDAGNKYLLEGNYQEAVLRFTKGIKMDPKSIQARIGLSKAYIGLDKYDDAEKVLKEVLEIDVKHWKTYIELANLYIKLGKHKEALAILEIGHSETNDAEIKNMIDKLKPKAPIVSLQGGTYTEVKKVEITGDNNTYQIYYTLDNSIPTNKSKKYTGPITIDEGTTILRAIAINQQDISSDEVKIEYIIETSKVARTGKQWVKIESVTDDYKIVIKDYYKVIGMDPANGGSVIEPDTTPEDLKILDMSEDIIIYLSIYYKNYLPYSDSNGPFPVTLVEFKEYINLKKYETGTYWLPGEFIIMIEKGVVTEMDEVYYP
jgi:tetratricopeptide (TPR) repeat protein